MNTNRDRKRNTGFDLRREDIIDSVEDELLVIDAGYRIRLANAALQHRLQKGAEALVGEHCYQVLRGRDKPCSAPLWECPLEKVLQSGNSVTIVHPEPALAEGNYQRYVKVTAYPLRDSRGDVVAVVELRRDVTAERDLETQILRRHHQLLALSRITSAVSGLWHLNAILEVALENVLELIGGSVGGILLLDEEGGTLSYRVHRGLSSRYIEGVKVGLGQGIAGKVAQTGDPILLEDISQSPETANPDLIRVEGLKGFIAVPLKAKDKVVGVMNVASHKPGHFGRDDMYLLNSIGLELGTSIEQAKLYARLNEAKERYRILLRQALTVQEEERKRIARELHDETGQELTALALNLQAIGEMLVMRGVEDDELTALIRKTHGIAVQGGTELTKLIRELRPTLLDTLGLPAALHRLAEANLTTKGISVALDSKGLEQRLPPEMELALFRITQEAMSNIVRHSEAKKASISLECAAAECTLHIEDDGKGFDVSQITGIDASGRGAGLFGMKERVTLVGGQCHIDSQPGKGTRITAKVPMSRSSAGAEDKGAGDG